MTKSSELNDVAVKAAIKQLGLVPGRNGEQAIPAGTKERVVEPTPQPKAPKRKKFSIELDAEMEARALREANVKGLSFKDYLQSLVEDKLQTDVGRALITGTAWMGGGKSKKVVAPKNAFGREVN